MPGRICLSLQSIVLIHSFLFIFPILIILLSLMPIDATLCPFFEQMVPFKVQYCIFFSYSYNNILL